MFLKPATNHRALVTHAVVITVASLVGMPNIANAAVLGAEVYGKIHASVDYVNHPSGDETAVASNASRIGFKGEAEFDHGLKGVWKLESQVDVSGEDAAIRARNRYLGIQTSAGSFLVGIHDTPMKDLGAKTDVFTNTLADGRAIRGARAMYRATDGGANLFDTRPANIAMYVSPDMGGVEVRLLASPGVSGTDNSGNNSDDSNPLYSFSAVYTGDLFWLGLAYERHTQSSQDSTDSGYRAAGGIALGGFRVNGMVETFSGGTNSDIDRVAYGVSAKYPLADTILKAQFLGALKSDSGLEDDGTMLAMGVSQRLGKSTEVYALFSSINNGANATYGVGNYHGEVYMSAANKNNIAYSVGVEHNF